MSFTKFLGVLEQTARQVGHVVGTLDTQMSKLIGPSSSNEANGELKGDAATASAQAAAAAAKSISNADKTSAMAGVGHVADSGVSDGDVRHTLATSGLSTGGEKISIMRKRLAILLRNRKLEEQQENGGHQPKSAKKVMKSATDSNDNDDGDKADGAAAAAADSDDNDKTDSNDETDSNDDDDGDNEDGGDNNTDAAAAASSSNGGSTFVTDSEDEDEEKEENAGESDDEGGARSVVGYNDFLIANPTYQEIAMHPAYADANLMEDTDYEDEDEDDYENYVSHDEGGARSAAAGVDDNAAASSPNGGGDSVPPSSKADKADGDDDGDNEDGDGNKTASAAAAAAGAASSSPLVILIKGSDGEMKEYKLHGEEEKKEVRQMFSKFPFTHVDTKRDVSKISDQVIEGLTWKKMRKLMGDKFKYESKYELTDEEATLVFRFPNPTSASDESIREAAQLYFVSNDKTHACHMLQDPQFIRQSRRLAEACKTYPNLVKLGFGNGCKGCAKSCLLLGLPSVLKYLILRAKDVNPQEHIVRFQELQGTDRFYELQGTDD